MKERNLLASRIFQTFLWKFILSFAASLLGMGVIVWLAGYLAELLLRYNPTKSFFVTSLLVQVINTVGSGPVRVLTGLLLFILLFFALSRGILRRFDTLTSSLQAIAAGDLSHRIKVSSTDELGTVARSVNEMARRLQLAQEEERAAVQAKNDLITGVSHDLRTPLTSILGFLEYIENDRYRDEVEMRQYVHIAYEKSLVLRKLIDDLFEYTRVTSSGFPLQPESVDLNPFLGQLADEFMPSLEEAGMVCRVHPSDRPLLVDADPELLLRVFENLTSNAIRYGAEGGALDIYLRRDEESPAAEVIFRNYGEPIPHDQLPKLFERFYRVDPSRSKATGGSGLGLAIVKSILELHGGTAAASSSKRKTEFIVRLPLPGMPLRDTSPGGEARK
jgi:signal transduction histidine kinase